MGLCNPFNHDHSPNGSRTRTTGKFTKFVENIPVERFDSIVTRHRSLFGTMDELSMPGAIPCKPSVIDGDPTSGSCLKGVSN